jgi:hypothetical protein
MSNHPVIFPVTMVLVSLLRAWQGLGVTSPVRIRDPEVWQVSMVSGKVPWRGISSRVSGSVGSFYWFIDALVTGLSFLAFVGWQPWGAVPSLWGVWRMFDKGLVME